MGVCHEPHLEPAGSNQTHSKEQCDTPVTGMKQLGFGAIRQIFSEVGESAQHPHTSGEQEQVGLGQGEGLLPHGGPDGGTDCDPTVCQNRSQMVLSWHLTHTGLS